MDKYRKNSLSLACRSACFTTALLVAPVSSFAAPGTLSSVPLFLDSATLPNIFFMVDDSGSMDEDLVTSEPAWPGVGGSEGLFAIATDYPTTTGWDYVTFADDNEYDNGSSVSVVPTQEAVDALPAAIANQMTDVWRARNSDYNKIYYNPSITYEPWSGLDKDGNAYADADPEHAKEDPYLGSSSAEEDLTDDTIVRTTHRPCYSGEASCTNSTWYGWYKTMTFTDKTMRYWAWKDDDSDGVVETSDTHRLIEILSASQCTTGQTPVDDGCITRTTAAEKINFANWWQYHRKREYAMKAAIGSVVANTNSVRMGISTLHASSSEERQIEEMNNDITSGDKKALLDTVYSIHSTSGTPLIGALEDAGDYYACTPSGSPSDPFGFSEDCPVETTVAAGASEAPGQCQQNFTILLTDGYYTDSVSGYGNADAAGTTLDGSIWTDGGVTYQFDGGPYGDSVSNSLADVAMHYYERDLISTLANDVPTTCGVDENPGQHMVTYTVGLGVEGSLTTSDLPSNPKHPKYAYDASDTTCTATAVAAADYPSWPATISSNASKIDDMLHAAYNGRGEFYSANDSSSLSTSISGAIDDVLARTGAASAVAFNSTTLGTNTHTYLALFDSSRWSGNLISYSLNSLTGAISSTADWEAATELDNLSTSSRVIMTSNSSNEGIPFNWSTVSALTSTDVIRTDLGYNSGDQEKRLNYIRGDRSNEGAGENYRVRTSVLGDIVHSTPVFVGQPNRSWPDTAPFPSVSPNRYSDFKTTQKTSPRTEMIYVGANDGMLHGFRASDGVEKLGYIPRTVFSSSATEGLHYLTDPSYGHRYYVDVKPAVSDAYIKTTASGAVGWHSVLIGSLGAGGQGIFALDITDPTKFRESTSPTNHPADVMMWEFNSSHDNDLGYTFSEPIIVLTNATSGGNNRWAAIFGNGYNSTNGLAKLFIVFLDGGVDGTWGSGDYIEISTGVGTSGDKNGLSQPAVIDSDGDGSADRVYAGDLKGNMWVFDISNSSANNWDVAFKSGSTPTPLFTGNSDQPITTGPQIVDHPTDGLPGNNNDNVMVYFGTGQYLTDSDISSTNMQSFYGVWDRGDSGLTRSDLVEQGLDTTIPNNGTTFRIPTDNSVGYANSGGSKEYGWFHDFDSSSGGFGELRERVVVNSVFRGNNIWYNTVVPSPNPCTAGGSGWLMVVDAENGGPPESAAFDFNNDGVVDSSDIESSSSTAYAGTKHSQGMPSESSFLGDNRYTTDTSVGKSDDITRDEIESIGGANTGRLSWEQLLRF